jgi:cytochrome c553
MTLTRWLCGLATAVPLLLPPSVSAQDALTGKRLYLDAGRLRSAGVSCVDCHGGLPGGAFGIGRAANDAAAVERAVSSIPQMAPFRGRLTGSDFADLAAYIGRPSVPSPSLRSATSGPATTTSANRLDFGSFTLSAQAERSASSRWHLVNDGAVGLRIDSGPQLRGEHPQDFQIVATDCEPQRMLVAGAACSVDLAFRPDAISGVRRAVVFVTHDWVGGEAALALEGTAVAAAVPTAAALDQGGGGGGHFPGLLCVLALVAAVRSRWHARSFGRERS